MNKLNKIIVLAVAIISSVFAGLYLLHEVYADTPNTNNADLKTIQYYELSQAKDKIKQRLLLGGKVTPSYVANVLKNSKVEPQFFVSENDYVFVTGPAGIAQGRIDNGAYQIKIQPIKDYDINSSETVTIQSNGDLPIAIKAGSGKVELKGVQEVKSFDRKDKNVNMSTLTIALFEDASGNKIYDKEEKILPLAGVLVRLTKINQETEIKLLKGWNLISLPLNPQSLKASDLLAEISKQGGGATAVSTYQNGAWKTFVARGNQVYSNPADDFNLEAGKAYFIKASKTANFKFSGQAITQSPKLNLVSGWNAVGLPLAGAVKADKLIDQVNEQSLNADALARWESGLWDSFVKKGEGKFGNNFMIENQRGYILRTKESGEVSF